MAHKTPVMAPKTNQKEKLGQAELRTFSQINERYTPSRYVVGKRLVRKVRS